MASDTYLDTLIREEILDKDFHAIAHSCIVSSFLAKLLTKRDEKILAYDQKDFIWIRKGASLSLKDCLAVALLDKLTIEITTFKDILEKRVNGSIEITRNSISIMDNYEFDFLVSLANGRTFHFGLILCVNPDEKRLCLAYCGNSKGTIAFDFEQMPVLFVSTESKHKMISDHCDELVNFFAELILFRKHKK